ncbi:hypothetical protein NDU88_002663 [Pleurodeles waltl]|uniref:Uncharacterized protein n=1 Tax=Pleurodeles waltl TaxID=8319 RepID=A0AAV7SDV8_PLEWA|nr:hypothetical protein NDU88_002663 [Pleurodeles waltl]
MLQPLRARFSRPRTVGRAASSEGAGQLQVLPAVWCKHRRPEADLACGITTAIGFKQLKGLVVGCLSF